MPANASYYRKLGLDSGLFGRSRTTLERALQGGRQLTRSGAGIRPSACRHPGRWDAARVSDDARGTGAGDLQRRERGQGVHPRALLEERVPRVSTLERDEALAELTRRYFSSRGPATVRDYVWWSGMTVRDARAGIEMAGSALAQDVIDGRTHWFAPSRPAPRHVRRTAPAVYLLPNYDEIPDRLQGSRCHPERAPTAPPWQHGRIRASARDQRRSGRSLAAKR